jgi:hypothetical protein
MLKHCAANRKRRLSALPNVDPYIYDVIVFGFSKSTIYMYDMNRLRVNMMYHNAMNSTKKKKKITSPSLPGWFWGLTSLIFNGHRG